ncbi:MAG: protein kinase, partial [Chitinivibrionales bacterium]|nr:protein kinase [Chitinivibrionales bacterium]
MAQQPDKHDTRPSHLRDAVEHTVPAEEFTSEALRERVERTAADQAPDETAQQYLRKTVADSDATDAKGDSRPLTSIGDSAPVPPELLDDDAAEEVGRRFVLQDEVGAGATSRVYAFRDRSLDRIVAVKVLRGSREAKQAVRNRFIHEARVTAKLEHPNIMPVHDIGTTDVRGLYFVMKHAQGVTLGEAITAARERQPVPREFAHADGRVRIFLKVLDAVAFAHSRGYIHQDIKPDNIMLGEYGEVLLLDWGSAVSREQANKPGGRAMLYGTPAYMSPEQARRDHVDERSDIYCLGTTLFHALLLRHPMFEESPDRYWERKREGDLDAPTEHERRSVPAAVLDIALKAMAPDPDDRYQSVSELADELKRYQSGLS